MKLFSAEWCSSCKPCKEYIKQHGLDVNIIDVEEEPEKAGEYGVKSLPTLILDDNTKLVGFANILKELKEVK